MTAPTPDYSRYFWRGEKVTLRPYRVEDAEMRFRASLDSPTLAFHEDGIMLPSSVEIQREWLEKAVAAKPEGMLRFVMENSESVPVGWITLHSRDPKNGTFGFGVAVYRDYRGRGYAADAAYLVLKYGFREQRYQKCNSMCLHVNDASIRLHQKLGFVQEGRIRRSCFHEGKYLDDVLFGLTREEFDEHMANKA